MNLKHLFRGYDYRARVHLSVEDLGLVPLDSIQTDDFQELVDFILAKVAGGYYVHWRTPRREHKLILRVLDAAGVDLIPGTNQMFQSVEQEQQWRSDENVHAL